MKYQEKELKEMISNLESVKKSDKLLLEDYTKNKYNEMDKWLNNLIDLNGTTEY